MWGRILLGCLVGVILMLGGCGGESGQPKAVGWATVAKTVHARVGSYTKTTTVESKGERHILISEWVAYDLDRDFIDRRLGLGDNPQTAVIEEPATRLAPSLRFLYGRNRVVMWNPGAAKKCGTAWVDMPEALIRRVTGFRLEDLLAIEPDEMLGSAQGEAQVVEINDRTTVYELSVPSSAAVPASALLQEPELTTQLDQQTVEARVTVGRDTGPIEIAVDLTSALETVAGTPLGDARMVVTWLVSRTPPDIDAKFPATVADSSCLS